MWGNSKRMRAKSSARRDEKAVQSKRPMKKPSPRSRRQAAKTSPRSSGGGKNRPQKQDAGERLGPQKGQNESRDDDAHTSRSRRTRKVANSKPSICTNMDAGKSSKPSGAPDKRAENFNATKGRSENIFSGGPKSKPELNDIGGSESFLTACGNEIAAWEKNYPFLATEKKQRRP